MTGQQLKNSILQLAIEGKLVSQDPNDEPASVLLQHIREDKQRLVREGKLKKKDLTTTPITDEEKPFDIPETWEWCRLGDVLQLINGDRGKNYPSKDKLYTVGEYPFISAINIDRDTVSTDNLLYLLAEQYEKLGSGKLRLNDIVLCIRGSLGKVCIYPFEKGAIASSLVIIRPFIEINKNYLLKYIKSPLFFTEIRKYNNGTAQPNLGARDLMKFLIPLPPISEQRRIVARIEELMPLVEAYGKAQEELEALNAGLPDALKKSILQEAIQGRLVPQDANDEPASVLLARIRKEKEQLVKAGKLKKKDLITTPITEEEKPFDIPETWEWVRVEDILNILDKMRKPVSKADRKTGCYPYYGANGVLDYVDQYIFDGIYILVGEDGSVIKDGCHPVVNKASGKIWVNNHAHIMEEYGQLGYYDYMFYCLQSINISQYIHGFMPKYSQGDLRATLIPLPPLSEQRRIVAKIETLFAAIDQMKALH